MYKKTPCRILMYLIKLFMFDLDQKGFQDGLHQGYGGREEEGGVINSWEGEERSYWIE